MKNDHWTVEEYRAYLCTGIAPGDHHPAIPAADAKPARRAEPAAEDAAEKIHPRYRIDIHHRSRRLADATGRSHKAAVDGIVRGGILPDDGPEYLEEIRETRRQGERDETVIEVWEII